MNRFEAINKLVDKNALLIREQRRHAGAFDLYGLVQKNDDNQCQPDGGSYLFRPRTPAKSQVNPPALICSPTLACPELCVPTNASLTLRDEYKPLTSPTKFTRRRIGYLNAPP